MHINKVPASELADRMNRFASEMCAAYPDWEICAVAGGVNLYYLTGAICDGVLIIRRGREAALWVRSSYERTVLESEFGVIKPMASFRDIACEWGNFPDTLYLDMSAVSLEWYGIFNKYLRFGKALPADNVLSRVRAVKSSYEIGIMSRAGKTIDRLYREEVPGLFCEGMSEAELGAEIFSLFIKNGYHGVSRFSMRNTDVVLGHICFAESSLYPSMFNGASGMLGLCPAAPVLGSRDVRLKKGNLIYIDAGFGTEGYNVDKTFIYSYKNKQPSHVTDIHNHCLELEGKAVSMLRAGVKPSAVYEAVYEAVAPELRKDFMGIEGRTVPFLGHGVGLHIDEPPVIARKFGEPLVCGMTIAIEPKIGIKGVGMTGSENTYLITEAEPVSLTGEMHEIELVE